MNEAAFDETERPPAFQFYCRDFLTSERVQAMTDKAFRAYVNLLAQAWLSTPIGTLPDDDRMLAAMSRTGRQGWQVIKKEVLACFERRGERWASSKLCRQARSLLALTLSRVNSGRKGAAKRWKTADNQFENDSNPNGHPNSKTMTNDSSASASASAVPPLPPPPGGERVGARAREKQAFVKPTLAEVTAHCQKRRNNVDPLRFLAHYESNGWRVGRNPMKNWKAAIVTWEGKENGNGGGLFGQNGNSSAAPARRIRSADEVIAEEKRLGHL